MERKHELIRAFDLARQGLVEWPESLWLKHRAILALIRMGAIRSARALLDEFRIADEGLEDIAALPARIAKEDVLEAAPEVRPVLARRAADLYEAVFRSPRGTAYTGINAATLSLLSGDDARSRRLADEVLARLNKIDPASDPYYHPATQAEAQLLKGDEGAAAAAIVLAAQAPNPDRAAQAATRRQLKAICLARGLNHETLLAPLKPPAVIHYTGHIIAALGEPGRFPAAAEQQVASEIRRELERLQVGYGYGSLAAGADLLFAEALLERGAELHVVLPFAMEDFEAQSVAVAGAEWSDRFRVCLSRASSLTFATEDPYLGHDAIYSFASLFAMGLAILQSRRIGTEVRQMVVSDGSRSAGVAGTARDIENWRRFGDAAQTVAIVPEGAIAPAPRPPKPAPSVAPRQARAMVFGDFAGFSKLNETQILPFVDIVMGAVGRALHEFKGHILHRNTWGDGLYLVFDGPEPAAECALLLQENLSQIDLAAHGLPPTLGLRLAGHYGLVYEIRDPVTGQTGYTGRQVSRTARIEPITPRGEFYVTDLFAALLALRSNEAFACDYVGHIPAAKDWGEMPMYLVRRWGHSGPCDASA